MYFFFYYRMDTEYLLLRVFILLFLLHRYSYTHGDEHYNIILCTTYNALLSIKVRRKPIFFIPFYRSCEYYYRIYRVHHSYTIRINYF